MEEMLGFPPLDDREFSLFQALVQRESGIRLSDGKRALLIGRLTRRLRDLGCRSFGQYYQRVQSDPDELMQMLDRVSTHETHFFREPHHFELLEREVLPRWSRSRMRVWSAACSTGEEPYSLAMTLVDHLPPDRCSVLGSDLSEGVLTAARAAVWPAAKAAEIPPRHLKRFMLRGVRSRDGWIKAGPELRARVQFARVNLVEAAYPVEGAFDLIFCRNVLIYFDAELRARVIDRLIDRLAPDGLLFVGHAESLIGVPRLSCVVPTVYRRR
jgi:chemotaxis protein methyltransferase CheR